MDKKINLIFDFDSTLVKLETIDVLADFALDKNPDKIKLIDKIKKITTYAMNGEMPFSDALLKRISLLQLEYNHIYKTIQFLQNNISTSIINNMDFFNKYKKNCYIVSGGFKEIIIPVLKNFNFLEKNIYANSFIYKAKSISLDINNPLIQDKGKSFVSKTIKGYKIIIGDGYTDYEVKKYGNADKFIQYTENINRKELNSNADHISTNFTDIIEFISNV